jgi:hypothetical protein
MPAGVPILGTVVGTPYKGKEPKFQSEDPELDLLSFIL